MINIYLKIALDKNIPRNRYLLSQNIPYENNAQNLNNKCNMHIKGYDDYLMS